MSKSLLTGVLLSAALFVAGCASVPMATPQADASAKEFTVPANGMSNLYIYRNETMGAAIKMPLLVDGMSVGDTGAHTFVLKQVAPGKHTVVSKTENDATIDLDVSAGQNYFVWQEVKMGAFAARSALHQVDEVKGQQAVKTCKLVQ